MWSSCLALGSCLALLTLLFVASELNEGEDFDDWGHTFIPLYVFVGGLFCLGCVYRIMFDRPDFRKEWIAFIVTGSLLILAILFCIFLPLELDSPPANWGLLLGFVIAMEAILLVYFVALLVARSLYDPVPSWASVYKTFLCCRWTPDDISVEDADKHLPAIFTLSANKKLPYAITWLLMLVLLIVSTCLAIAYTHEHEEHHHNSHHHEHDSSTELTSVFVPFWIGFGILTLVSAWIVGSLYASNDITSVRDVNANPDGRAVTFVWAFLFLVFVYTLLAVEHVDTPLAFIPLYIALVFSGCVFGISAFNHCEKIEHAQLQDEIRWNEIDT